MNGNVDDTPGAALRLVELAEQIRAIEVLALEGQALLAGVDPDLPGSRAVHIASGDIARLRSLADAFDDSVGQLRALAAGLPGHDIEIRWHDLEREAAQVLALGVADVDRVELLARCLSVRAGFRALAEALRCTDSHESWGETTLGEVLGRFRDADPHFVRRLTGQARLSPETRFADCDRARIARLAGALEDHIATARCR